MQPRDPSQSLSPPPISDALQRALASIDWVRLEFAHQLSDDLEVRVADGLLPFVGDVWRSAISPFLSPQARAALFHHTPGTGLPRLPPWCLQAPVVRGAAAPAGSVLEGALTLFGHARPFADACLQALASLDRLPAMGGHARLRCIHLSARPLSGQLLASPAKAHVNGWDAFCAAAGEPLMEAANGARVHLESPLSLSQGAGRMTGPPSLARLFRACLGRLQGLAPPDLPGGLYAEGEVDHWLAWADTVPLLGAELSACGQARHFSATQQRSYPVLGDVGHITYGAPAALSWPWLRLAQHIQIGTNVTQGLGVIGLAPWPAQDPATAPR